MHLKQQKHPNFYKNLATLSLKKQTLTRTS
jgi:hypothetical protein